MMRMTGTAGRSTTQDLIPVSSRLSPTGRLDALTPGMGQHRDNTSSLRVSE